MKLISATVRFPADEVRTSSQGRQYLSALFADDQGQQHRVFGPPTFEALRQLQPGQRVQLAEDSRGRLHLVEPDQLQAQPMGFAPAPAPVAPQPQVQQQQYQAAQVPVAAPAGGDRPQILAMADQWAAAFRALTAAGVPAEQAGAGASCCLIQANGRR